MSVGRRDRDVVVTGLGAVTPLGGDVAATWQGLLAGRRVARRIDRFAADAWPTRFAAMVDPAALAAEPGGARCDGGFLPPELESGGGGPWSHAMAGAAPAPGAERWGTPAEVAVADRWIARLARQAAAEALAAAGLAEANPDVPPGRRGLVLASGLGLHQHRELTAPCVAGWVADGVDLGAYLAAGLAATAPGLAARQTPGGLAVALARRFALGGPVGTVQTACAAGTQALGDGARWIRRGLADLVLVVGADSEIYPLGLASFCLVGALSRRNGEPERASRPFDRDRDGFVLGEGAAAVVLESAASARRRGAVVFARLAGFGSAADAWRATDPHPDGDGALLAMQRALAAAGVATTEVGHVNAHATSTAAGDVAEARALVRLFGSGLDHVAVSASKSMLGHLTTAAGVVEAVVTVRALCDGLLHPTANLDAVDPACALDHVRGEPRRKAVGFALSNGFAFGGQCASVLLAHADA